jgi:DNA-binding transcriptional MocR family regulator
VSLSSGPIVKHRVVSDAIRRRIDSGEFLPGQWIPTESALVKEFGVSRPTIARALRELQRQEMVRQPCVDIGRAAYHAMLDRIEHPEWAPRHITLGCELIVRDSTIRGRNASAL